MHAEKCPVCRGTGKFGMSAETAELRECHGCNGRGWVEVRGESNQKPEMEKKLVTNPEKSDEQ
jgi:DnaJ-class molecular chaperone